MNEFLLESSNPNMRLKLVSQRVELPKLGFIVARRVYNTIMRKFSGRLGIILLSGLLLCTIECWLY